MVASCLCVFNASSMKKTTDKTSGTSVKKAVKKSSDKKHIKQSRAKKGRIPAEIAKKLEDQKKKLAKIKDSIAKISDANTKLALNNVYEYLDGMQELVKKSFSHAKRHAKTKSKGLKKVKTDKKTPRAASSKTKTATTTTPVKEVEESDEEVDATETEAAPL